jgi:hypothetical protein
MTVCVVARFGKSVCLRAKNVRMKRMSEVRRVEFILEFVDSDDYSQCCFCEHKYLSAYCRECPVREDPMPDEVVEEDE